MLPSRRLILPLAVAAAACGEGPPGELVQRSDSAGVEIVRYTGADRPLDWRFERTLSLGGEEAGPQSFYRVGTLSASTDTAGRLFVLDASNHRVVVFDSAGNHLTTMGREGGGPGEFRTPYTLTVAPDGDVTVFDFGKGALLRFTVTGQVLGEQPFGLYPSWDADRHMAHTADGLLVSTWRTDADGTDVSDLLLQLQGADTLELARLTRPRPRMTRFTECGGALRLPPFFAPELLWDAAGGRVAVNAEPGYVIDLLREGRLLRSVRRAVAERPATESMALQQAGDGWTVDFGQGNCSIPPERLVEGFGYADVLPALQGIAVAPDGRIWAQRYALRGSEPAIDLFAADGSYTGTLPPGTPFPVTFLSPRRIVAVETDELDVERLVVYRIVETR